MKLELPTFLVTLALMGRSLAFGPSLTTRSTTVTRPVRYHRGRSSVFATVEEDTKQKKKFDEENPVAKFDDPNEPELLGEPIPYSELTIGVVKETFPGENRVSQTPDSIRSLVKEGFTVVVESGGKLIYYYFSAIHS